ncbi:hypothetical protein J6590_027956 [Homalodisca vitripennis]|nr:hypothetical protein J6590_027956 [Homalodisca vitripennis]
MLDSFPGLTRPPIYPFTAGQYPYPMLSPEMTQVAASCPDWSCQIAQTLGKDTTLLQPRLCPLAETYK